MSKFSRVQNAIFCLSLLIFSIQALGQKENLIISKEAEVQRSNAYEKELAEGFRLTTNNRMELMAVIKALEALKKPDLDIIIHSDSSYVVKAVMEGWLKKWLRTNFKGGIKNKDLWLKYNALSQKHKIHFNWVKGHAENVLNNRCDILATQAADGKNLLADEEYEKGIGK